MIIEVLYLNIDSFLHEYSIYKKGNLKDSFDFVQGPENAKKCEKISFIDIYENP